MRKKFGCLNAETWQSDLKKGFSECWRVLEDYGILTFKWNDIEIPYKKVLSVIGKEPLYMNITVGQKALKTKNRSIVKGREQRLHRLPPSKDRAKLRSRTYPGIAKAMAEQWGTL